MKTMIRSARSAIYPVESMPSVGIETHGCKLNQADTQTLAKQFSLAGYRVVSHGDAVDVFVLNSCTVTHVADRKARQAIRSARRRNPDAVIVATGCYAHRDPDEITAMSEVDLVVGNFDKPGLVDVVSGIVGGYATPCAVGDDIPPAPMQMHRARAMVKIQEGCNQVCAYCIVPKVRGRERSIPADEIASVVNGFAQAGYREVVLTGTQLGSYGFDLDGIDIRGLIAKLLNETEVPRIRVSSLQPQEISDELLDLWQDSRLCPHFHVPLQSGSDAVLPRMRRRYSVSEFIAAVERIRAAVPDAGVTADAIVGFPGETEADFLATVDACVAAALSSVHVFPYSPRPGTSAAYYGEHVDAAVKSARARDLGETARELANAFRQRFVGATRETLWERRVSNRVASGTGVWSGLTDNYIRVQAESERLLENRITLATLTQLHPDFVSAVVPDAQ